MPKPHCKFFRTDVKAMWKLLEDLGREPVSVKFHPDGTFRIMTKAHVEAKYPGGAQGQSGVNEWDSVYEAAAK